jgi:hypothetical protein
MKRAIFACVLLILLIGCAAQKSPSIVCNSPYIRNGAGCCLDKNINSVCDTDEKEEPFFAEPTYDEDVPFAEPTYSEPAEQPKVIAQTETAIEEPAAEEEPSAEELPVEPSKAKTATYNAPVPKLQGWKAENAHMSIEVTKIVISVENLAPVNLISPTKKAYLKEMYLKIHNADYNYLNPRVYIKVSDFKDPIIIHETLLCDKSDDITMEGCNQALPETETMGIRMQFDRELPRLDLQKTFRITLQNRRDNDDKNILEIEKTYDVLKITGAEYT